MAERGSLRERRSGSPRAGAPATSSSTSVLEMGGPDASSSSSTSLTNMIQTQSKAKGKAVLSRSAMSFRSAKERYLPVTQRRAVYMAFSLDVMSIDVRTQSFTVAAFINFFWRVTPEEMATYDIDMSTRSWEIEDDGVCLPINAKIKLFDNQISLRHLSDPHFTYLEERGVIQWRLNVEAELSEGLELDRFPFDRQLLTMHINVRTAQWRLVTTPPAYIPDLYGMRQPVTYRLAPSVADWVAFRPKVNYTGVFPKRPTVSIQIERASLYFVVSVILPLFLIVGLSFLSFAIARDAGFHERATLVVTLLLTSVALKVSIDDRLPQTPYLTLMDRYIVGSWLVMAAVCGTHAVTQYVGDDRGEFIDYYAGFGLGIVWLFAHLVFWIVGCSGGCHRSWDDVQASQVDIMEALEPDVVVGVPMTDEERAILRESDEYFVE